jgi:hypothetical protein
MVVRKIKSKKVDMDKVLSDPRYRGKHVIAVADKVFTSKTGEKAGKILEMVHRDYPKEIPQITYIPEAETLILCH